MITNNEFTRLTLEQNDTKVIYEVPYADVTGDDMIHALKTIMIGMTFNEGSFVQSLINYVEEHTDYKVIKDDPIKGDPIKLDNSETIDIY